MSVQTELVAGFVGSDEGRVVVTGIVLLKPMVVGVGGVGVRSLLMKKSLLKLLCFIILAKFDLPREYAQHQYGDDREQCHPQWIQPHSQVLREQTSQHC